jgi:hypothetical protein
MGRDLSLNDAMGCVVRALHGKNYTLTSEQMDEVAAILTAVASKNMDIGRILDHYAATHDVEWFAPTRQLTD